MPKIDERAKLVALAHLKTGKKPAEVATLVDIPYSTALKLNKDLKAAEEQDAVLELFNVSEAAFQSIIQAASEDLAIAGELVGADEVSRQLSTIKEGVDGLKMLDASFQRAANTIANQINLMAASAEHTDSIVNLAEALAKLQSSFFAKGTNVQINNYDKESFQQFLGD